MDNDLFTVLNLDDEDDIEQLDVVAIIEEVQRNPHFARQKYPFKLHKAACYPLHHAIMLRASYDVVHSLFVSYPRAIEAKYYYSDTALSLACWYNSSPAVVSLLVEKYPAAVKKKIGHGKTALHAACSFESSLEVVSLLVNKWPEAVMVKCEIDYCTPLHTACEHNAPMEVILFLLQQWPEAIKEKDRNGETPTQISWRNPEAPTVVRTLLFYVSQIFSSDKETNEKPSTAAEIMEFFEHIEWFVGVPLLFDRYPAVVQTLGIGINSMPNFLSFVGCRCKITTISDILRNKQDIFAGI